jgi:hypothetical protein
VTLLSRIQWFSSATSATWLATWTGLLFELHWVLSHSKLGGWPGVAVTIPGTTLCSAMVTSCVLVCSCTSCGQTLLLLHRTQSLAYVLGLALGTLLGVFGFGACWSLALQRELLPSHSVAPPLSVACFGVCCCRFGRSGCVCVGRVALLASVYLLWSRGGVSRVGW